MSAGLSLESSDLAGYASALRRYFRKRVPAAEVDDLVQEVFLSIQARRAESRIENLSGYLFTVAARVLLHYRMEAGKAGARLESIAEDHLMLATDPSPERLLASREELRRLVLALESLPPRTRDVFVLHRFEEMTYSAIAKRLHISVSAVEKQIMNALGLLKGQLEREP
jgi:RNA polymerase sigma-70 factor (ECF subfamily)